jgi:hypothetical protein
VDHVPEFIFAAAALITAVTALIREIKRKQETERGGATAPPLFYPAKLSYFNPVPVRFYTFAHPVDISFVITSE